MYNTVNILDDILPAAETYIMDNDRGLYRPFFTAIEKYCHDNDIVIGGDMGMNLILNEGPNRDRIHWELYTDEPFEHAKRLAREIFKTRNPHVNARYTFMRTDIKYREFTIVVNTRPIVRIQLLDKYRGVRLIELMKPVLIKALYSDNEVRILPADIQLIGIYRLLYSPGRADKWKSLIASERDLHKTLSSIEGMAVEVVGGGPPNVNRATIDKIVINKLARGKKNVLIGDYALISLGADWITNPRLQMISDESIETLAAEIEATINKKISTLAAYGFKIATVKYPLNIPTDFQITKHTLYINIAKDQIPIIEIFNSSSFEMIPFWPRDDIKIGNPWVLMRWQYIDLWIIRLISKLDSGADPAKYTKKISAIIRAMTFIHGVIDERLANEYLIGELFQLDNYVGVYINETVAKKHLLKDIGERFPFFYPALE